MKLYKKIPFGLGLICAMSVSLLLDSCQKTQPTIALAESNYSLKSIRELSAGILPDGYSVTGTVTSNSMLEESNLIHVQDDEGSALKIRFDGNHNFNLGDRIQIYVAGCELAVEESEYEIREVKLIYSNRLGAGTIVPKTVSAQEVNSNFADWSGALVRLQALQLINKESDDLYTFKDSIGSAIVYVSVHHSLGLALPDSAQFISGIIANIGGKPGIRIRNAGDVVSYSPQAGDKTILESFDVGGEGSYASGDKVFTGFSSGDWMFNEASVLGVNEVNDLRNGAGSVRLRGKTAGGGYLYTLFDVKGLQKIRFLFGGAKLGEGGDEIQEYSQETFISKDGGSTWVSLGKKTGKKGEFTLMEYDVDTEPTESVRIKIQNTSFLRSNGNRLRANVDDVELIY